MENQPAVKADVCRILVADDDQSTLLLYLGALGQRGRGGDAVDAASAAEAADAASAAGEVTEGEQPQLCLQLPEAGPQPVFEIVQCRQAEEVVQTVAAALADDQPFAVAFLDVMMPPGPDGIWAAEQIRALDPDLQIILVTVMTTIDPEEVARRIPPRDKLLYVHKPLDPLELQSLAAAFASKWRVERLVEEYQHDLEQRVDQRTAELARVNEQLNRDIIERRRVEEALRKSEASLARAQRMAHLGSWEVNCISGEFTCSDETVRILGRYQSDPPRTINSLLDAIHPEDRPQLEEWLTGGLRREPVFSNEHRIVLDDGTERTVHQLVVVAYDTEQGRPTELRGAIQDITDLKRSEEQIVHQAYHDALTGLPNRRLLNDRLQIGIAQARRRHQQLAVLLLDMDGLKQVNDSFGYEQGDLLLQAVAGRLVRSVRKGDTVARSGGDEFLVLLLDVKDPSFTVLVAKRLLQALSEPFPLGGTELQPAASIGITLFPDDAETPGDLIANADIAMYRAKEQGPNSYKLFAPSMNRMVMERMSLELNLHSALDDDELLLYYQPIIDISSGRPAGVEALLRWHRPGIGLVPPDSFIPVAERIGLIVPIGEWVLRKACEQVKRWHDAGLDGLTVAVNLSPSQLQLANLVSLVKQVLRETGLPPDCLVLEVTEAAVMSDVEAAIHTMEALSKVGVRLAMDDFGKGSSSLYHLKRFPLHTLKVDRSFIAELMSNPEDEAIVRAIISLGRSLDLELIAEGVETPEQLDFLKLHDCDRVQGFLFGKPAPAEEAIETLRRISDTGPSNG